VTLENTKHKLAEASYFLGQAKLSLTEPVILSYYLSAFVSAARSVTFVMQFEFGKNQEHKEWYEKKQEKMKTDRIFSIFKDLRDITIHQQGKVRFKRKILVQISEPPIINSETLGFKLIRNGKVIKESNPIHAPPVINSETPDIKPEVKVILESAPQRNGIDTCNKYLEKLNKVVSDAETMVNRI
jgi:hypothetical protein